MIKRTVIEYECDVCGKTSGINFKINSNHKVVYMHLNGNWSIDAFDFCKTCYETNVIGFLDAIFTAIERKENAK